VLWSCDGFIVLSVRAIRLCDSLNTCSQRRKVQDSFSQSSNRRTASNITQSGAVVVFLWFHCQHRDKQCRLHTARHWKFQILQFQYNMEQWLFSHFYIYHTMHIPTLHRLLSMLVLTVLAISSVHYFSRFIRINFDFDVVRVDQAGCSSSAYDRTLNTYSLT